MDPILNTNEYTEVENRGYLNPQVGLDESNRFIDQLRATQAQQNQQIATDTYNLGTAIPSAQGGLGGNLGYFTSRYQTPATNATVANLRATAQAAALNQALENEQAIWKKRYQDAYRAYQKRQYDASKTPTPDSTTEGGVDKKTTDLTGAGKLVLDEEDLKEGGAFLVEPASGDIIGEGYTGANPRYVRQEDGSYKKYSETTGSGGGWSIDIMPLLTNYWQRSQKPNGLGGGGW